MQTNLISVIVPCYNASRYITDTLHSVLKQKDVLLEVIVINDGSTDDSEHKINSINDPRLSYKHQANQGVSVARNTGLDMAKGEYIIFFDSDDIMSDHFLLTRLQGFMNNPHVDFVSGTAKLFDDEGNDLDDRKGPDENNLPEQILLYDKTVITCPSLFLFKSSFLISHSLRFNEKLSSTADRFFLLQCYKVGKLHFDKHLAPLYYRVTPNSMSNLLNEKLVRDNEVYYNELKHAHLIPSHIKNKSLFLGYYILFGAYWKIGKRQKAFFYAIKCFIRNPIWLLKRII
jgi:glycosyltransferase involved in cell wall biosynthesis